MQVGRYFCQVQGTQPVPIRYQIREVSRGRRTRVTLPFPLPARPQAPALRFQMPSVSRPSAAHDSVWWLTLDEYWLRCCLPFSWTSQSVTQIDKVCGRDGAASFSHCLLQLSCPLKGKRGEEAALWLNNVCDRSASLVWQWNTATLSTANASHTVQHSTQKDKSKTDSFYPITEKSWVSVMAG